MEKILLNLLTPAIPPEWIKILPLGQVNLGDDREPFRTDSDTLTGVQAHWQDRGIDMVIDYEHQTMMGIEAPAAGWIRELDTREDGLWARVDWTPNAYDRITNREYRYISPVVELDESRNLTGLLNVALTNYPAINNLDPLTLKSRETAKENDRMKGKLIEILGLSPEAETLEIMDRITKGRLAVEFLEDLGEMLSVKPNASEIKGAVLALKASPDVIARLQGEVDQLKAERASDVAEKQLELALRAGKITPAMREWALNYAKTDPQGFEAYVANAPKIVPIGEELDHQSKEGAGETVHLNAEDKKMAVLMGVSEELYMKSKIELAGRPSAGE
jgi:phage I-like protein